MFLEKPIFQLNGDYISINEKLQIKISRYAYSSCHFLLNNLKGTAITLPAVILYCSTLSGTNRHVFIPEMYDEHPGHFYRGVPPGEKSLILLTTLFFVRALYL